METVVPFPAVLLEVVLVVAVGGETVVLGEAGAALAVGAEVVTLTAEQLALMQVSLSPRRVML